MTWHCNDVWATTEEFDGNSVRQLLVPDGDLELSEDATNLSGTSGTWAAVRVGQQAPARLHVRIPLAARAGERLHGARWEGPRDRLPHEDVLASYFDLKNSLG